MTRLNRYAQKRRHIREQEKRFAKNWSLGSEYSVNKLRSRLEAMAQEDSYYRCKPRNNGWEYWKQYDISGRRQFAKKYSDKRIRQKYRQMIHHMDVEDVTAPHGSDYQKEFDYAWTIW